VFPIFSTENELIDIKESVDEEIDVPEIDRSKLDELIGIPGEENFAAAGFSEGTLDEDGSIVSDLDAGSAFEAFADLAVPENLGVDEDAEDQY
jgi:hypothetical protein